MARTYYLTTAIDYANGEPHAGHAFEKVGADAVARYRRRLGDDVRFVIGMDEHGQSIVQEAERRGVSPQELVDEMAVLFRDSWDRLRISYDDFIRTTEHRHRRAVEAVVERVREAGDLYRDSYEGYYCVRCEAFKKEEELVDGRCPNHPNREIQWTEEENFFFRLSAYRNRLLEHVREHPDFIRPDSRRNEILRLLEGGLDDVSASRPRIRWGTPFPGEEEHTVYVWVDALTNYLSATGFPGEGYDRWWPAQLHVIGKDITRFHCVIWPALLMSAGLELPDSVWGHGFVSVDGGKISKSAGARLELDALVERHGADAFRYFLLREAPWDGDRDFPSPEGLLERFDGRYDTELANDLGNLLNRVVSMVGKYRDGRVPAGGETALDEARRAGLEDYHASMADLMLHRGLDPALELVRRANRYVDEAQPWELAKREREIAGGERSPEEVEAELDAVLGSLLRTLAATAAMLEPFVPAKASEMWEQLGGSGPFPTFGELEERVAALDRAPGGKVLFPRRDLEG
jgi:methionyl-tRNA synthetase